jgi:hypothetical protein
MAFMNIETTAFLIREEGFDFKPFFIAKTSSLYPFCHQTIA